MVGKHDSMRWHGGRRRNRESTSLAAGRKQTKAKWKWGQARLSQNHCSFDKKREPPTVD